jgi:hypothetical protein
MVMNLNRMIREIINKKRREINEGYGCIICLDNEE